MLSGKGLVEIRGQPVAWLHNDKKGASTSSCAGGPAMWAAQDGYPRAGTTRAAPSEGSPSPDVPGMLEAYQETATRDRGQEIMWGKGKRKGQDATVPCRGCDTQIETRAAYEVGPQHHIFCCRCFLTHDQRGELRGSEKPVFCVAGRPGPSDLDLSEA